MLKKTITYKDFDGNEQTKDFYFNLSSSEITKMELSTKGGLVKKINQIIESKDGREIVTMFQELILAAYGEKSEDGQYFQKSEEISKRFSWTPAYDQLFMELSTNADAAAVFVNGIVPQNQSVE